MVGITKEFKLSTSSTSPNLDTGSIFFIGNATVLIRFAGFTILTDPTFIHMHEKVHLGYGLSTIRLTNPAINIGELPPLDFIILSHFHGDHFDRIAISKLDRSLPIITTPHASAELKAHGFERTEKLETWESISYVKGDVQLTITATPGRHDHFQFQYLCLRLWAAFLTLRPQTAVVCLKFTSQAIHWSLTG